MARQQKKLPSRRSSATDESLLIRSAESLGRVIGTLQRQLDAARRFAGSGVGPDGGPAAVGRHNGHAPARQRAGVSAKPASKTKSAAKSKTATARKRPATKRRATKD